MKNYLLISTLTSPNFFGSARAVLIKEKKWIPQDGKTSKKSKLRNAKPKLSKHLQKSARFQQKIAQKSPVQAPVSANSFEAQNGSNNSSFTTNLTSQINSSLYTGIYRKLSTNGLFDSTDGMSTNQSRTSSY